jgi:hypothetical protein
VSAEVKDFEVLMPEPGDEIEIWWKVIAKSGYAG